MLHYFIGVNVLCIMISFFLNEANKNYYYYYYYCQTHVDQALQSAPHVCSEISKQSYQKLHWLNSVSDIKYSNISCKISKVSLLRAVTRSLT